MDMTKIHTDNDFSNAVVPEGQVLIFTGMENGKAVTRYKDSSGNFGTIAGNGDNSGNSSSMEFYKCASVDTMAKTWTGYKAVLTGGVYSFEETVTTGLTYGTAYTPRVDYIYNSIANVQVTKLWDGIIMPQEGLVFYASLTDLNTAETGQTLTSTSVVPTVVDGIQCGAFDSGSMITAVIDPINDYGTTSLWFRTDRSSTSRLFALGGNPGVEWNMYTRGDYISFGRGGDERNPAEFSKNVWHHFVCTSNEGVAAIYLDGQSVYQGTLDASGGGNLYMGDSGDETYSGYLANVRVYNRPLNPDEVILLYNESTPTA